MIYNQFTFDTVEIIELLHLSLSMVLLGVRDEF